jgi:hypothetical protein
MFNDEFFPTPKEVIEKMVLEADLNKEHYILDPSAGKGDILEYIKSDFTTFGNNYNYLEDRKLYGIELNQDLATILKEKEVRVLADDFLEYEPSMSFDRILMNPPFSNGDEHLLKAWEILDSGKIVCLLNAETIKNPYTKKRKLLLEIISKNGYAKEMGQCFKTAERKTNVEVVMVVLEKTSGSRFEFDIEYDKEKNTQINSEVLNNQIATNDAIGNIVKYYQLSRDAGIELVKAMDKFIYYSDPLKSGHYMYGLDEIMKDFNNNSNTKRHNKLMSMLKKEVWEKILDQDDLKKVMSSSVRETLNKFIQQNSSMDITEKNIKRVIYELISNRESIYYQTITSVFETMTSFHKDNKVHVEGWKTNSAYKVNKRIILPYGIDYNDWGSWNINYRGGNRPAVSDIDLAISMIDGKDVNEIDKIYDSIYQQFKVIETHGYKMGHTNKCESEYFNIKFYKKGTLHLQFKDDKLWELFNVTAAQGKNWIGTEDHEEYKQLIQGD